MDEKRVSLIIKLSGKKAKELLSIEDEDNIAEDIKSDIVDRAQNRLSDKAILEKEIMIFNSFNEKEALNKLYPKILSGDSLKRTNTRRTLFKIISIAAVLIVGIFLLKDMFHLENFKEDKKSSLADNNVVITTDNGDVQVIDNKTKVLHLGNVLIRNNPSEGKITQSCVNKNVVPTLIKLQVPSGKTYQLELPDGTIVKLNSKSSLAYYSKFTGKSREVTLYGEAYFEVAKNTQMPFIVKGSRGEVTVLGTRFNIKDYCEDQVSKITLIEGSVSVSKTSSRLMLTPGNMAYLSNISDDIKVEKADLSSELAWVNERFDYKDVPLEEIAKDLDRWFGKKITFETADLSQMKVTLSTSRSGDIERIITMINHYSGLSVTKSDNSSFLIKKNKEN